MTKENQWTEKDYYLFWQTLQEERDEKYRLFQEKLLCSRLPVVGLRVPLLRKSAKAVAPVSGADFFLHVGEETYEERLLYGLVLSELLLPYEVFLKYCDYYTTHLVENWAHCDIFCGSIKKQVIKNEADFFRHAKEYLSSENPWVIRVGLIIFLSHYLKEPYLAEVLFLTDGVHSSFYYVEMAQAWLLATAWVENPVAVQQYLEDCHLSVGVKKKFVQKARDSFRVSQAHKEWLGNWKKDL